MEGQSARGFCLATEKLLKCICSRGFWPEIVRQLSNSFPQYSRLSVAGKVNCIFASGCSVFHLTFTVPGSGDSVIVAFIIFPYIYPQVSYSI